MRHEKLIEADRIEKEAKEQVDRLRKEVSVEAEVAWKAFKGEYTWSVRNDTYKSFYSNEQLEGIRFVRVPLPEKVEEYKNLFEKYGNVNNWWTRYYAYDKNEGNRSVFYHLIRVGDAGIITHDGGGTLFGKINNAVVSLVEWEQLRNGTITDRMLNLLNR